MFESPALKFFSICFCQVLFLSAAEISVATLPSRGRASSLLARGTLSASLEAGGVLPGDASGSEGSEMHDIISRSHNAARERERQLDTDVQDVSGLCIKNTGRSCQPYKSGTIIDQMAQCHTHMAHNFSAPSPRYSALSKSGECSDGNGDEPQGFCVCKPGYCADQDTHCHHGGYFMVDTVFSITTKSTKYNSGHKLYMDEDGKVRLGEPRDEASARWQLWITPQGLKHFVTEKYAGGFMQEYEECAVGSEGGYARRVCGTVVGRVARPRADEVGWHIEIHSEFTDVETGAKEHYMQLRSMHSSNFFFVSPLQQEARTCQPEAENCPGDYGALRFDPPLEGQLLDLIDDPPISARDGFNLWMSTYAFAIIMTCMVYCLYSKMDQKTTRYDDSLSWVLVIPFRECAKCIGLRII